ncbi:class I SAM-dependent methyltransferase [Oceanospirillum beijerinckii]|uniref:class I SAM-dependent methyltransferase n=1 Tax=Oceanospirillum beijerinckii TaxID=64976 RepID=UPI00040E1D6E|nr:class I SAM-dependent methyltransferase [Oceanospirillum beijerinckii]
MRNIKYLLSYIDLKMPLHKKKIDIILANKDIFFIQELESFLADYSRYLEANNLSIDYGLDAYIKMVKDMIKCQIKFMRTGNYPVSNLSNTIADVYNNKEAMLSYMIGLALSQYLWESHYKILQHFRTALIDNKENIKKYIEIGPGHGLFLRHAITNLDPGVDFVTVDISRTSLEISKSIIEHAVPDKEVRYINKDILSLENDQQYDFILMGEVLEHVEQPELLLRKIHDSMATNGKAFLSTCVNCPAIDHLYHFKSVDDIRSLFNDCGLEIESETVVPVENLPMEEIVKKKITINYSALVNRKKYD